MAALTMRNKAWRYLKKDPVTIIALCVLVVLLLTAVFGPHLAPFEPTQQNRSLRLGPPSTDHWFGTDNLGRDVLSRILVGARYSLSVGSISVGIGLVLGTFIGLIAGYFGGAIDTILSRLLDILMAFPTILLAVVILAMLGPGLANVMIAVGFGSVPMFARLIRSAVVSLKEQEYVTAARASGRRAIGIIVRHLLPNLTPTLIVVSTIRLSTAILSAAALSFLGLGAPESLPEWGTMLSEGRSYIRTAPHLVFFPGFAIMITALVLNVLGDALRDVLDPFLKE